MTTTDEIANLIARSVSHNEIAHAEWTPALAAELQLACDDPADCEVGL